ncbi:MAG: acyl carrier protein [Bacteroidaceae bacterium]|nr:acyl carrier protein [Bacteroidaceae bacterium]
MDINSFIELVANQFVNTEPSEFKPDTKFRELDEFSSLIALYIIGEVFEVYGVSLKSADILSAVTIQDLFCIVEAKNNEVVRT